MIITMSPAKLQDFESPIPSVEATTPLYAKEARELYKSMEGIDAGEIASLMNINPQLAHNVYQYIHAYPLGKTPQRQAALAYNGIAYQGLDAKTFSEKEWEFAQKHLVHISGLYGVLRPLDLIKPYRLEMQIPLANNKGKDLYAFWRETISKYLAKQMKADDNVWINLASKEYAKAVDRKLLPKGHKVITPIFKQHTDKGYKQIVVYAKKARGMMTRFIIQNQLTDIEHLKGFDTEGYTFAPQLSDDKEWIFVR
ncbi:peroxide stress protein YaaA [Dysgonomonas sp. Marseille-P4677]|uniref:peroxide stress protein YaaA n=1 Tax=Dysgonomonas sp. Marseille-P4677 TaxID=2364790 RepID=UPI001911E702|nr:peroxide stress protein YaaA [Dysgonomonas sp. Marseille-P4677]MBK5721194.1 peroxide stress protein YaaA [Dysgonomonas sp. Marseille-P4677]